MNNTTKIIKAFYALPPVKSVLLARLRLQVLSFLVLPQLIAENEVLSIVALCTGDEELEWHVSCEQDRIDFLKVLIDEDLEVLSIVDLCNGVRK